MKRVGTTRNHHDEGGFAAIMAIFVVVGLSALGAAMLSFSTTQQVTSVQDLRGSRAYLAAHAGLEWGLATAGALSACPASNTSLTIDSFSVSVYCSKTSYTDPIAASLIKVESIAKLGSVNEQGYVERSLVGVLQR